MGKTIHIDIMSITSIRQGIKHLQDYQEWIERKAAELVDKLAAMGAVNASIDYSRAIYDGTNDISVTVENWGENRRAIVATGSALLFIEFGAGVIGGGHPMDGEFGYGPGTYPGQTHVPDPGYWWYTGDDGLSHFSRGNQPTMTMYLTAKELRERVEEVAREVFSHD